MGDFSIRVDDEKQSKLDKLTNIQDRSHNYLVNQAIDYYLKLQEWQIKDIEKGILEADAGDFASDEEVHAILKKYK
jgi:predicted transcriptional regulator